MAHVARLHAVHVDAVAVDGFADAVAGAVEKIVAVAGFVDDGSGGFVDLPALQRLARGDAGANEIDGRVASILHDVENFSVLVRNGFAQIGDPSDIVIDAAWS